MAKTPSGFFYLEERGLALPEALNAAARRLLRVVGLALDFFLCPNANRPDLLEAR